jgi:2-polyprenyl-3-methyl-5-hydroxy-6-metoxy-1,4-benzoquinol methylase
MIYDVPPLKLVEDRIDFVIANCAGKCVLHLGCAASGVTAESLRDGTLLHLRLREVAKRVIGMDLDGTSLTLMRAHGIPDLIEWDVERLAEWKSEEPIDVVMLGETLEHLSNPGLCLRGVSALLGHSDATLLLTVPNAFSLRRLIPMAVQRRELVMPDHTAYFSPSTLTAILGRYQLTVEQLLMYSDIDRATSRSKRFLKHVWNATLLRAMPQLAEGLIVIAKHA